MLDMKRNNIAIIKVTGNIHSAFGS